MTQEQFALLLTTARILRARCSHGGPYAYQRDDIEALNEALAPFDPSPSGAQNEAAA